MHLEPIQDVLRRIKQDPARVSRIKAKLDEIANQEPLIAETFHTPQSPTHHAEGPWLKDHLFAMLATLDAVKTGDLQLLHTEELGGMKGYDAECTLVEDCLKQHAYLLEIFILCHDIGKWTCLSFDSEKGSHGNTLGFSLSQHQVRHEEAGATRAQLRSRYKDLYEKFVEQNKDISTLEQQVQFFLAYRIELTYPGHERVIHRPIYRDVLDRLRVKASLPPSDTILLETMISHHIDPFIDFEHVQADKIRHYVRLAQSQHLDSEDFLVLMQACIFLDAVGGATHRKGAMAVTKTHVFENFLHSAHDAEPWKHEQRVRVREQKEKERKNVILREVELDGESLKKLFNMPQGPAFGALLKKIHAALEGEEEMPVSGKSHIDDLLKKRATAYYARMFK